MTRRARAFLGIHGHRLYTEISPAVRDHWTDHGIPPSVIEQMVAYEAQWGGWLLPPAPHYEGGPKVLRSDMPEADDAGNWWFDAGDPRASTWYGFLIGPDNEFCIDDRANRVILHSSTAGWVESVALAYRVRHWAPRSVTVRGPVVDELDLSSMEPFVEVAGVSDGWWRGADTVIAVYRGEAWLLGRPEEQIATIYSGITEPEIYLDY